MKNILLLLAIAILSSAVASYAASTPSVLQFRLVVDSPTADSEPMNEVQPENSPRPPEVLNVQKAVLLDQTAVKSALVNVDNLGNTMIDVRLTDDGAKRFAEVTRQNLGKRLAIVIDGKLYEAPRIATAITGGEAIISGAFTREEAKDLATKINGSPAGEKPPVTVFATHATPLLALLVFGVLGVLVWMWTRRQGTSPAV